jgi:Tfp pilus assembly protein FimV
LIEEARRRKAEGERETEARFHEAQELADRGDRDGARALLTQLLEPQPFCRQRAA